jgi:hypothetical protein
MPSLYAAPTCSVVGGRFDVCRVFACDTDPPQFVLWPFVVVVWSFRHMHTSLIRQLVCCPVCAFTVSASVLLIAHPLTGLVVAQSPSSLSLLCVPSRIAYRMSVFCFSLSPFPFPFRISFVPPRSPFSLSISLIPVPLFCRAFNPPRGAAASIALARCSLCIFCHRDREIALGSDATWKFD